MGLDMRWPIGLMFTLIGALLALNWGIVLLVFGVLMLLGAIAGSKKNPPPST